MEKFLVKGEECWLISEDDVCPICEANRKDMHFSWNMFHGEATSSCCGAIFQIKTYHIDNPDEDQKKLLRMLNNGYIEFSIKKEWVGPLKSAIKEIGICDIRNSYVMERAENIMGCTQKV